MSTNLTDTQLDAQVELLTLGAEYGDHQLEASMRARLRDRLASAAIEGRPLRVYTGYDPTAPDLHIGHSITLRAMRRFQEFGHHVIVVVGTMTAMVGERATVPPADPGRQLMTSPAQPRAMPSRSSRSSTGPKPKSWPTASGSLRSPRQSCSKQRQCSPSSSS
jgi:hypothetical protein